MYHSAGADIRRGATFPVPLTSLVGFERVRLATGAKITIRGKDISDQWQTEEEMAMQQHVPRLPSEVV